MFVFFKGGDKLTLALGNKNLSGSPTSSGSSPPICDKLINLDSPPPASTTAPLTPIKGGGGPPLPPPRTTSDPNYNINKSTLNQAENNQNNSTKKPTETDTTINENNNDSTNLSVTYFSSGLNGHGIERETIFTDDRHSTDAASIVRQHLGGTGSNPFTSNNHNSSKNPFLNSANAGDKHNESLDDIVEKKIQDLINANPFNKCREIYCLQSIIPAKSQIIEM